MIFSLCIAYANTGSKPSICFVRDYVYTSDIETDPCAGAQLMLRVKKENKKLWCTITVDDKKISGFLVKNNDSSNKQFPELYDFHRNSKPANTLLFVNFHIDSGLYKADIINEKWIQQFKPCFDHKGITLQVVNNNL